MSRRRGRVNKASTRASRGGGTEVALAPQHSSQAATGPNGEWFGPGRPLPANAPRVQAGRRYDYPFGTNIMQTPRAEQSTSFSMLRALADRHDLTRLAIETRKDQMARLSFGFKQLGKEEKLSAEQQRRADEYTKIFRRPDGKLFWGDWLRQVLEDLLVIDAPSIFVRRTNDEEQVVGFFQVDGATIKPIIDDGGREPEPPETAYQQWMKGIAAWNYTSRELIYAPRNRRVHTVYGYSPVEQIIATINIALRRQIWQHAYFTDGNIPDSLIGVPSTWSPDQIAEFQDWFDGILVGNDGNRRRARFVPGEVAKSYVPTKDAEMFGGAEEWLARVVCFCFGISYQALVKEVNRATSETAQEQALMDGLSPIMNWVKSLMDGILLDHFGEEELEFTWMDDKELDPKVKDEIWSKRVDSGMASRNEWRGAVGEEPRPELEASMLLTNTKTTPLSLKDQIAQQTERTASGVFPDPTAIGDDDESGDEGSDGVVASGEEDGGEGKPPPPSNLKKPKPKPGEAAEKGMLPFAEAEAGKAATPHDPDSLSERQLAAFQALSPERPAVERARRRLQRTLQRGLGRVGARVVAAVRAELERIQGGGVAKADEPETPFDWSIWQTQVISVATEAVGTFDFLIDATADVLEEVALSTTRAVAATIGEPQIVDVVSERSVAAAEARAAELVGRRILADGSIVDNPNARWAITDSTRTMIHDTITRSISQNLGSDAIISALEDDHAFSPARAEMVSRTEVADINSQAAMDSYREAEEQGVSLKKEWILGENPCDICQDNADQGPIPLDDDFDSGDDTAPAHPNCVCAVVPVTEDD